jgi:hypothetical protein
MKFLLLFLLALFIIATASEQRSGSGCPPKIWVMGGISCKSDSQCKAKKDGKCCKNVVGGKSTTNLITSVVVGGFENKFDLKTRTFLVHLTFLYHNEIDFHSKESCGKQLERLELSRTGVDRKSKDKKR